MIRHVVLLRWTDDRTDEQLRELGEAFDALPALIEQIVSYQHGRDLGVAPTNHDYAVTAEFADTADFVTYRDHPEHQRIVADHFAGRAERVAVQFELAG